MKGTNAMQILFSRSLTKVPSMKAFVAAVIALIVCSNLAFTGGMANNIAIVRSQAEKEQLEKKVDDRLIAATSRFAFKIYDQVLKQRTSKNVFISPASVILALAMTYNGAEGETRQAMADALEVEGMSLEEVNRASADLQSILLTADSKVQLKIANSLWARNGFSPKPTFIQRSKEYYAAEVASLDFASPSAPARINSWVKTNTEGKIEKIVDLIDQDTILFLINAIYFKGQWQVEFAKEKTKDDVFRIADGHQKKLPMMFQSGKYQYQKGKDFQAVVLPYGSGRISMYVFLPDEHTTLDQFERNLTPENWENWMRGFRITPGELTLPRFKVEYEADLNDMLKALGMAEAFDPLRANFSGIAELNPGNRIYISKVKHKAFAEVNEEGTEAAAVTSVVGSLTSAQQPQENFIMKVDHPFFFAIRDNATGVVLFIGSVADPG
jgi:serine protease inhibitor